MFMGRERDKRENIGPGQAGIISCKHQGSPLTDYDEIVTLIKLLFVFPGAERNEREKRERENIGRREIVTNDI